MKGKIVNLTAAAGVAMTVMSAPPASAFSCQTTVSCTGTIPIPPQPPSPPMCTVTVSCKF